MEEGIIEIDEGFGNKWDATDITQEEGSDVKTKVECTRVNWEWDDNEEKVKRKSNSWNMTWQKTYILSMLISRQIKPLCISLKPRKEQWMEHICSLWELKCLMKGKQEEPKTRIVE